VDRLNDRLGLDVNPVEHKVIDQVNATARARHGDEAFAAARAAGRARFLEEAIDEALHADIIPALTTPAPPVEPWRRLGLTRREHDVLRLLVAGHTNRAIGHALFISERTVEGHVLHLMAKLGVESRTAAVAIAVRDGLT
jgi:DNA-binding NarL/FixJ family response regulator